MTAPSSSSCTHCGSVLDPTSRFCPRCGTGAAVAVGGAGPTVAAPPRRPAAAERNVQVDALRQATLGEYEILTELGRGGMATVYLAHDLPLDRKVAIKVLAPALLLMGEGMVERFKREARTAAALSHPHIIPIYAVKESEQVLYFVMKYVRGRPLDAVIRDAGPLPIAMVQTILAHVGDALGYAHRHGVVHRDVKSANIMLDEDGWAVVTDFGIAKVVQAEGLTVTGVTVGTPTYMSPEQCATHEVTGASDQYSLGVVAYEMLTGRLPFQGDSIMAVMYAHFNERPRPVTELRPDCPPNLGAAVMRMLEKDPPRRWTSMDDVVAVCGRPSLRHDDPVRREMISLAKAGDASRLLGRVKTPTSPIALSRPHKRPPATAVIRPARRLRPWWGLGAVAIVVGLAWLAPWRAWRPTPPTSPVPAGPRDTIAAAAGSAVPADTAPVRPAPVPPPARVRREAAPARVPVVPPAPPSDSAAQTAVPQWDDSLLRSLRASAQSAMSRALQAGATGAERARGDTVFAAAETLATHGRLPGAMVQFATAASLWGEAERVAQARTARDTLRQPAGASVAPADPRVEEIAAEIAAYARALGTRDLGEVRRAYPGLRPSQRNAWRDFFQGVRKLQTILRVTAVEFKGDTAEAEVSGVYDYVNNTTGRADRQTIAFRATLVQDSTGWRLTSIH